jgi:NADPH:quinone reductase-like Zn-dependent oxidoreductase
MRAWCARAYGGPEVLELREVPLAPPRAGEVLVRVEATTVSSGDRRIRALDVPPGMGWMVRAVFGLTRPRNPILGAEFTGVVAAVGQGVTRWHEGDAVIGLPGARQGAHAEYARMPAEGKLVARPEALSLEAAAALSFGGCTARHFLRRAALQAGERVLVIGASGTVGSAIIRLALAVGAQVTGVASAANQELVRGLGAEETVAQ